MSSSYVYGTLLGAHWLPERACPRCGNHFEPTDRWAYKINSVYYCSYHCYTAAMREVARKPVPKHHKRALLPIPQLRKIFQGFECGKSQKEIALSMSIGTDTVHYYYRKYFLKGLRPLALQREERLLDEMAMEEMASEGMGCKDMNRDGFQSETTPTAFVTSKTASSMERSADQ